MALGRPDPLPVLGQRHGGRDIALDVLHLLHVPLDAGPLRNLPRGPRCWLCDDQRVATTHAETRGRIRLEHGAKRVRAYLGGELVADTTRPVLVWEVPYYPAYYFPVDDVRMELLEADGGVFHSPSRGDGTTFAVRAGERE